MDVINLNRNSNKWRAIFTEIHPVFLCHLGTSSGSSSISHPGDIWLGTQIERSLLCSVSVTFLNVRPLVDVGGGGGDGGRSGSWSWMGGLISSTPAGIMDSQERPRGRRAQGVN